MKKVDLHMHTVYSDGTLTCEELLEELISKNIELFSITDHENIESITEMKKYFLNKSTDIKYVPGVEIATTYLGKEFHLTVYGCDEHNEELKSLLHEIRQIRIDYGMNVIKHIEDIQITDGLVNLQEFINFEENPHLGGWKALNYLKKIKVVDCITDYFKLLDGYFIEQVFPTPKRVIEIAKKASGKVFLAHPSSNQKGGLDNKVLDDFVEFGIDGIECFSAYCENENEINNYVKYCDDNNLYISGGSDYHGTFVNRNIGEPEITRNDISYELFIKLSI